ncbi:hypothetical protein UA08_01439 [Talaromyces atroroseus]|uniref:Uncharacterized protein n=1 Tax=Talaromyces atroroseus TaxID=1441469 RepID=A0A1Q5QBA4_TALAT|nr:hypothetical protein UA08_01439 [Talaromyces atroroseus]OKL63222.1 hypothetical protein UA08_01439 [Talaromyces atroroseus]
MPRNAPRTTAATDSASIGSTTSASSTRTGILGPFTTTFTPPSHCTEVFVDGCDGGCDFYGAMGQTCFSKEPGYVYFAQDTNCFPSVTATTSYQISFTSISSISTVVTPVLSGFYSPGIACPVGYVTACAVRVGNNGLSSSLSTFNSFSFDYAPLVNETAVGCCPIGYQCELDSDDPQACTQVTAQTTLDVFVCATGTDGVTTSSTQLVLPTVATETDFEEVGTVITSASISIQTTTASFITLYASMVQINYQSTDLPSSPSPSPSSSSSSNLSSTLPPTSTGNTSIISPSGKSSGSHETTTIAVAVVIPCMAALIAAAVGWFWYRRKTRKRDASYQAAQSAQLPEMDGQGKSHVPAEDLGEQSRYEIPGSTPQYEMAGIDSNEVVHEMYAGDEMPRYRDDE